MKTGDPGLMAGPPPGEPGRHRRRSVAALVGVLCILASALAIVISRPTEAPAAPAAVSTTRTAAGFPRWYADEAGVRLEACLDGNDPLCAVLPNPGIFDPALPLVFPTNFPDEAFYLLAESTPVATPGCAGTRPGEAFAVLALEQAFSTGDPMPGAQQVFGRIRIVADGLCPNTPYTFTHPYGRVTLTTEDDGSLTKPGGTVDIGCAALLLECDFAEALASPVLKSFLRWDPAVAPAAPAGYLGDPNVLHPIVGAPFNPGSGPANYFEVQGAGIPVLRSTQFSLSGKLAGPLQATPEEFDAGNQPINIPSVPRDVTLTNVSSAALTVNSVSVTPAGSPFSVTANTCATVAVDATCAVTVRFAPTVVGPVTGSLVIDHGSFRSPTVVPLTGTGTTAVAPNVTSAPASLDFGRVRTADRSMPMGVVITNRGPGVFSISSAAVVDSPAGQAGDSTAFLPIASNDCPSTGVLPGTTCTVRIAFTPAAQRPYAATLRVVGTVGTNPITLTADLSGRGGLAVSSMGADGVGPDGVGSGGFPTWYQDDRGVRLSQCLAATDPNCVVAADATFDPAAPLAFPTNYPGEAFYFMAESERMATPGCGAASPPGLAGFRAATEQTFTSGVPTEGEQLVFGRVRLFVTSGLCPGQSYTFVHPYGTFEFVADELGGLKRPAGTTDIGCFPSPTTPCNFNLAVAGPVSDGYLRWDTTAPAPPAGYLGDAATLHTIAGAPFIEPGASRPANYVKLVDSANAVVTSTERFTVMGKIDPTQTATKFQTVAPKSVAFGNINVGVTSPAQTITVESVGTTPLTATGATIAGPNAGDFSIVTNTCAAQPVGSRCTLTVTFRPTATGARSATLNIASDAANGFTGAIPLTGTAGPSSLPVLSVTPTTVTFPNQLVGTTSTVQTVTVTNVGGSPLTISGRTLGGANPGDFTATGCATALNPGVSCTLSLTFGPPAAGARTATLTLASDGGNAVVTLNGTGVTPVLSVTPTTLTFASQAVGSTSTAQAVTVSNTGTAPLSLTAVAVGGANGADFLAANGCTAAVAPGASCTVNVTFRPTAIGARAATLTVGSNGGTATVTLNGTAVAAAAAVISATPATVDFGNQAPGAFTAPRTVTITNTGTADLTVTGATATALAGGASYRVVNNCTVAVVPGGTCTVTVAFEPGSLGAKTGTLSVTSNGGTATVALTGNGFAPVLAATPATLTFASQTLATTSPSQTVTVTNNGNAPLTVTAPTVGGANAAEFTASNGCTVAVAPGASCTIGVTFRPTVAGARTASLSIGSNGGTATVTLNGTGAAVVGTPVLRVTPSVLDLGNATVGTFSASRQLTITNTGGGSTLVNAATAFPFTLGSYRVVNNCTVALVAGASCTLDVSVNPGAVGSSVGVLVVTSSSGAGTAATILANGVTGPVAAPVLSATPATLTFASQALATTSPSQSVTVTNTGTAPLTVTAPTVGGANAAEFTASNGCTVAVAPGASCTIGVTFRPTVAGARTASLSIGSNGGTATVALNGTGAAPVTPPSLAANRAFALGANSTVQRWDGTVWVQVSTFTARSVATAADGTVLAVDSRGATMRYVADNNWTLLSAWPANQVAVVNTGTYYIVDVNGALIRFQNGGIAFLTSAGVRSVAAASDGTLVIARTDGSVAQWSGTAFTALPGALVDVAVSRAGVFFGVASDGTVWRWTGTTWVQIGSGGRSIAAAADGTVLLTNSTTNAISRYVADNNFAPLPGGAIDVAVR